MRQERKTRTRLGAVIATVALALVGVVGVGNPATADVPALPSTAFTAPACEGSTLLDPGVSAGPVTDLHSVFGTRLDEYNAGQAVPLYDSFGQNNTDGYPPVCATRYVEGIGPVSEWMFCTDYYSHVCSGVDAEGNLLDIDGNPIPGLNQLAGPNPKLTSEQETLIAYLAQFGQPTYDGTGYFNFNDASRAVADGDSWERSALQVLIWCISDPVAPGATGTELERAATCENNMGAARQSELLAAIPSDPTVAVSGPSAPILLGESGVFEITTDVFTTPLTVSTAGVASTLQVIGGPGVLTGNQLQVSGSSGPQTVTVSVTSAEAGTVSLTVAGEPASTTHIAWNQSPGVSEDGVPCQVYATFRVADQLVLSGSASATFAADDDESGGGDTGGGQTGGGQTGGGQTDGGQTGVAASADTAASEQAGAVVSDRQLASTGGQGVAPVVILGASLAALIGLVVVAFGRRRAYAAPHTGDESAQRRH